MLSAELGKKNDFYRDESEKLTKGLSETNNELKLSNVAIMEKEPELDGRNRKLNQLRVEKNENLSTIDRLQRFLKESKVGNSTLLDKNEWTSDELLKTNTELKHLKESISSLNDQLDVRTRKTNQLQMRTRSI